VGLTHRLSSPVGNVFAHVFESVTLRTALTCLLVTLRSGTHCELQVARKRPGLHLNALIKLGATANHAASALSHLTWLGITRSASHSAGSPALAPRDSGQALDSPVPSGRHLRSAPGAACGRGSSCPSPGTARRQATHARLGGNARQARGPGPDRSERAQRCLQPWQHLPQHQAEALRGQRLLRCTP